MALKSIRNVVLINALGLGALVASGCDNGSDSEETDSGTDAGGEDAGGEDAGGEDAGGEDAGGEDAGGELPAGAVMCGDLVCEQQDLTEPLAACCTEDAEGNAACGLEGGNLDGEGVPDCVLRDAPGVESASCGMVWDLIDGQNETDLELPDGDGLYTSSTMVGAATAVLQFKGCCTAAGACSIDFASPEVEFGGTPLGPTDIGYGCTDPAYVGLDKGSAAIGFGDTIDCDPTSGMVMETPDTGDAGAGDGGAGDGGAGDGGAGDGGATDAGDAGADSAT